MSGTQRCITQAVEDGGSFPGAYARGDNTLSSDVDILVEFEAPTFHNYMDLKFAWEELLGKQVDLVVIGSLKPALRATVMAEATYVA